MVQFSETMASCVVLVAGDVPASDMEECRYGTSCYRVNPHHFEDFQHPDDQGYSHTRIGLSLDSTLDDVEAMLHDRYIVGKASYTLHFIDDDGQKPLMSDEHLRDAWLRSCSSGWTMVVVATFTAHPAEPAVIRADSSVSALHDLVSRMSLH
mmetsp:Transcript_19617/g.75291  ORF Transcript_19617/g.75291 Transcript_19617/m.75291 type:complete len:152 (-) Transcript_19617:39-494(-)